MVKKILNWIIKIAIFILAYLLQIYVVNNTAFFGVNGDLCLMVVAVSTLLESNVSSYVTAVVYGITSDLLFSPHALKYLVIYLVITAILIELKKMYKSDSKIAVIIFSAAATVISEIIMYIFTVLLEGEFANIFVYLFNIFKQGVINICLAYVIYLVQKQCVQEE